MVRSPRSATIAHILTLRQSVTLHTSHGELKVRSTKHCMDFSAILFKIEIFCEAVPKTAEVCDLVLAVKSLIPMAPEFSRTLRVRIL